MGERQFRKTRPKSVNSRRIVFSFGVSEVAEQHHGLLFLRIRDNA